MPATCKKSLQFRLGYWQIGAVQKSPSLQLVVTLFLQSSRRDNKILQIFGATLKRAVLQNKHIS